ncbi:MAG: hypothetical protein A2315_07815 [Ignavibacteria bacterium RIFOXYB2_FULL_35_12]|nr:MAG: hypothetical protein A2058_04865 [Ignavibacteria bacterium GWA2_36_19]OGU53039.1 MAG: hypothetical protein A2006_08605 [Ignavibacteria bacterium GWC2_35_8]OGU62183.1 MAG: hypothetical protein A2X60_04000 [Ignavibacteria bacterium GWF2_35_20]OGU82220.1 MAG: hypothetical protein A2254_07060 [Ignavibacteria bacterium RIFOXYA2_FULL_35_9]OGU84589.1 MAG: hypothetical protein A3K31_09130 [Ignavibacteria bacterium RIFOXYA12_FULL_35_25]OGU96859.1 MAG: hypothetical protein A2347_14495 [Ignavibac
MKSKIIAVIIGLIIIIPISAQNKISLLETKQVNEYLILRAEQSKIINPMIEQINKILEEDKNIITELKKRFDNGDEPGIFEKISVKRGRDKRAGDIEDLIEEIEDQLSDEQKIKYKEIEKSKLKSLSKEELLGKKN